jgi:hypothetical protein
MEMRQFHYLPPTPGFLAILVGILAVLPANLYARPREVQANGSSEADHDVRQSERGETAGP